MKTKKLRQNFKILTIAGSDPSGGAGVQADLRVFQELGLCGQSVITAVTAQNEKMFIAVNPVSPRVLREQLQSVGRCDYVKIGMLGTKANVQEVIRYLKKTKPKVVVLDPVFRSSTGAVLLPPEGIRLLQKELLPLCTLVTPNLAEAETLTGLRVCTIENMKEAAQRIQCQSVLIKGGHLKGSATDVLYDGKKFYEFTSQRFKKSFHGTGCVLSSMILSYLALGYSLKQSVEQAKSIIRKKCLGIANSLATSVRWCR